MYFVLSRNIDLRVNAFLKKETYADIKSTFNIQIGASKWLDYWGITKYLNAHHFLLLYNTQWKYKEIKDMLK